MTLGGAGSLSRPGVCLKQTPLPNQLRPTQRQPGAVASSRVRGRCKVRPDAMGRIWETRKHTMFARWNRMAKAFTRCAKEITIAVKAGGPSADSNPSLRRVLHIARAVNMP